MKKLILILLSGFFISFNSAYSQLNPIASDLGIGYNIGLHTQVDGLEFVISRYNATRSWLDTKMETPAIFRGMTYSTAVYYPKFMISIDWTARKSDVWARGVSSLGEQTRDFRYKVNTFNFGYGKKLKSKKSGVKGKYFGVDFCSIFIKNSTRVYKPTEAKQDYEKINSDFSIGFSPFLQLVGNRFSSKIYYQLMLSTANYVDVNKNLNPNTWFNDSYQSNKGKTSSLGIAIRYKLFNSEIDKGSKGCLTKN